MSRKNKEIAHDEARMTQIVAEEDTDEDSGDSDAGLAEFVREKRWLLETLGTWRIYQADDRQ
jgi:hypothetical protein